MKKKNECVERMKMRMEGNKLVSMYLQPFLFYHVFHYPIKDGRVTDDLVFHPFKLLPIYLTETAIDYMTPMCQRLSIETDGINHEWFISSEKFTKPFKVRALESQFWRSLN